MILPFKLIEMQINIIQIIKRFYTIDSMIAPEIFMNINKILREVLIHTISTIQILNSVQIKIFKTHL